jgi:hypothetical protein
MSVATIDTELPGGLRTPLKTRVIDFQRWPKEQAKEFVSGHRGGRFASMDDVGELITGSTLITDPVGKPVVAYLELDHDFGELRRLLDAHSEWDAQARSSGLVTVSLKFGKRPRTSWRFPNCSNYVLARGNPRLHKALMDHADLILPWYRHFNAELFEVHHEAVTKIHPAWRWNPIFTSGVANRDSQLPYHYDAGNFRSVWSGMFGLKEHIREGALAIPELGVALEISEGSLTMFDGQGLLHGVTPMRRTQSGVLGKGRAGHRYTIVYYGLQGMWQCLEPAEEAQRAAVLRTAREARRREKSR